MKKNTYRLITIILLAVIVGLVIAIVRTNRGEKEPVNTQGIIINKPTPEQSESILPYATDIPVRTENPAGETETPQHTDTPVPTGTPTPVPTPTPTPVRTGTPGGKTSSNPEYAGKKLVAITFDDGPGLYSTPKFLDMLKEKNVKATFFVLGEQIKYSDKRKIMVRASEEGHEIAVHSYNHVSFKKLSADEMLKQVNDTAKIITEATGKKVYLFRPPGGNVNSTVLKTVPYAVILWSVDSNDWAHLNDPTVEKYMKKYGVSKEEAQDALIDEVLFKGWYAKESDGGTWFSESDGKKVKIAPIADQIGHGDIILFHDIHETTYKAVAKLVDYLREKGDYEFLTVTDLIKTEGDTPKMGEQYSNMWKK